MIAVCAHEQGMRYRDEECAGLSYYGYRHYNPSLGRWLNRDPLGEFGSVVLRTGEGNGAYFLKQQEGNLYGFLGNRPGDQYDLFGLADCSTLQGALAALEALKVDIAGITAQLRQAQWGLRQPNITPEHARALRVVIAGLSAQLATAQASAAALTAKIAALTAAGSTAACCCAAAGGAVIGVGAGCLIGSHPAPGTGGIPVWDWIADGWIMIWETW